MLTSHVTPASVPPAIPAARGRMCGRTAVSVASRADEAPPVALPDLRAGKGNRDLADNNWCFKLAC